MHFILESKAHGADKRPEHTKIRADVCGSNRQISFVLKECVAGGLGTQESGSDVLLSFRKESGEEDICTYWGALNPELEPGNYFVKE